MDIGRTETIPVTPDREHAITKAFVTLANNLVDGYDVVELLSGLAADCAAVFDIDSAGLLLVDPSGVLHVMAASSEKTRNLELFQLQRDQGPCLDCFKSGEPVIVPDLAAAFERWPTFVPTALAAGYASVHAVPLRLQDARMGALGLFGRTVGSLSDNDIDLAQALAHVGSVAIVQGNLIADKVAIADQLQQALNSRVVVEQAKGILAQLGNLDMEEAFAVLRRYARDHNQRLAVLANSVVSRQVLAQDLLIHAQQTPSAEATRDP